MDTRLEAFSLMDTRLVEIRVEALHALWTQPMRKLCLGTCDDIAFEHFPIPLLIANVLAVGTNG
jgi:hypothetical protein